MTGDELKALALKHSVIVTGYEFCERFDFDAIAAELDQKVAEAFVDGVAYAKRALKAAARERGVENAYNFFDEYLAAESIADNRAKVKGGPNAE